MKILLPLLSLLFISSLLTAQDYQQFQSYAYHELDSLMGEARKTGQYDRAMQLMQAGKAKAEAEFGQRDSVFAEYCGKVAFFHKEKGTYDEALTLFHQAIKIQETIFDEKNSSLAKTYNNLGSLHEKMGYTDKAMEAYLIAKDIWAATLGKEHPNYASVLNNIAYIHRQNGSFDKALLLYTQARNIRAKTLGKSHQNYAISLNNIATVHVNMGNMEKALETFKEGADIIKNITGESHPYYASLLNNIAYVHRVKGDFEEALRYYNKSCQIFKETKGEKTLSVTTCLDNIASTYYYHKDYEDALKYYKQAGDIRSEIVGELHPRYAYSLNMQAMVNHKMEAYEEAWRLVNEAVQILTQTNSKIELNTAWAEKIQQVAFATNTHLEYTINSLELMYKLTGDDKSLGDNRQKQLLIADLSSSLLDAFQNSLNTEKDKLRLLSYNSKWMKRNLKLLTLEENTARAFQLVDQNKSVLLLKASQSRQAYTLGELPKNLVEADKSLRKSQSKLQALLLEAKTSEKKDSLRNELIKVTEQLDEFVETVKEQHPNYHRLKYQPTQVDIKEIQESLPAKTAMLEYAIQDSVVHIFSITADRYNWQRISIPASELKAKIKEMHSVLSDYSLLLENAEASFYKYTDLAYYFYQQLLQTSLASIPEVKNLIIVTDGELGHLPFEAFLMEQPAANANYKELKYVLTDYNVSYHYSATLWKNKSTKKRKHNNQILAIAADYGEELSESDLRGRDRSSIMLREALQPLPAAKTEVQNLGKQLQGSFNWEANHSERFFKAHAKDYAIIHLAMHGLLNDKEPVLSSLAFTEDGDSLENNFLQAYEISKMELNADLVVLSACETGYGRFETGNGIASLARAFMYAGVPSMVVSLWQVNDESTSRVMQQFYQHLADGQNKAEALRMAKLDYLASVKDPLAAHPAFWSPFVLIGDEGAMQLQQKTAFSWLWLAGIGGVAGLGLLVLLGRGRKRRKRREWAMN